MRISGGPNKEKVRKSLKHAMKRSRRHARINERGKKALNANMQCGIERNFDNQSHFFSF